MNVPETIIQSPNYPDEYDNNMDCTVKVTLNEGEVVSLEILYFYVHETFQCENDFLEIRDGDNQEAKLIKRICGSYGSTHFKASGNTMLLRFHSNGDSTAKGFRVKTEIGIPHNLFNSYTEFDLGETVFIYILLLLIIRLTAQKCYCEHKNGGGEKNGWLCGTKGESDPMWSCAMEEWCIGPFTMQTATANYKKLCLHGRILQKILC